MFYFITGFGEICFSVFSFIPTLVVKYLNELLLSC